jgi:SAM-dependent methyltransferase
LPNPIRKLGSLLAVIGVDTVRLRNSVRGLGPYLRNRASFKKAAAGRAEFPMGKAYPCFADRFEASGLASGQYFHQDLHVAQLIHSNKSVRHVDVGSRVDGFVAHVAVFCPIEVYDIRELTTSAANITFKQRDLMQERPDLDGCTDSLSCLHTLEHFGLGRYGDPLDYDGYKKGWESLYRMVRPGGKFYFSTPIGPQRIEFDAHRVFAVPFLVEMMKGKYRIDSFAYVNDAGELVRDVDARGPEAQNSFGCRYGCGIFELTKL